MESSWKNLKHRVELLGVKLMIALSHCLPMRLAVRLGGMLGAFAFDIVRIRRRVTLENLDRAFGDSLDAREKIRIARRSYINFAKSVMEFASLERMSYKDYESLVHFEGLDRLREALGIGKGVVAVTGHFGSWELLGAAVASRGIAVDFLVGEQANKLVNAIMNRLRRSAGIGIIERGVAARGVFESLKRGRLVAMLADQDARKAGIFVDFFGTPASTFQGPAQFSVRMGSPIVCSFIVRNADDTHKAIFSQPIYPDPGADREGEIRRLTSEHTRILERFVRLYPDHYFWAHRRWKTVPPTSPSKS